MSVIDKTQSRKVALGIRIKRTCTIQDCTGKHVARGLCDKHYRRWRMRGDPELLLNLRGKYLVCLVDICGLPTHAHGYCQKHLYRKQHYGDPLIDANREAWGDNLVEKRLWHLAKARSKTQQLDFRLSRNDVRIPECCPVLGIPLIPGSGKFTDNSPSLDRIVPSMGYVTGNVHVISMKANRIKTDATVAELRAVTDYFERLETRSCHKNGAI